MDEIIVFEVPGTDIAVIVSDFELATQPLPAEARDLPYGGQGTPYRTALDVEKKRMHEIGYREVDQTAIASHDRVVTLFIKMED